jgi:hypothetical protein
MEISWLEPKDLLQNCSTVVKEEFGIINKKECGNKNSGDEKEQEGGHCGCARS